VKDKDSEEVSRLTMLERLEDRLNGVPEDLREGPVVFAAAALIGPFVILLLASIAGSSGLASPLYTLAAVVFVGAAGGFIVTSYRRFKRHRAEDEHRAVERARRRTARRRAAVSIRRSRATAEAARRDERRAS
jgi:positive regulator of sigma E activity